MGRFVTIGTRTLAICQNIVHGTGTPHTEQMQCWRYMALLQVEIRRNSVQVWTVTVHIHYKEKSLTANMAWSLPQGI